MMARDTPNPLANLFSVHHVLSFRTRDESTASLHLEKPALRREGPLVLPTLTSSVSPLLLPVLTSPSYLYLFQAAPAIYILLRATRGLAVNI
jgi:hypothetical protein